MSLKFTRRKLATLLSGAGASLAFHGAASSPAHAESEARSAASFPKGFLWGSATASYQTEGAVRDGGRGPSIWDTFSHTNGKVAHGDTGDIADDFFHRYQSDISLMKQMGLKGFRFSVSWSRIQPTGRGQANQAGLDFYKKLADALLAAGIEPFCTLYHWDLPQALQDQRGWENPDTAAAFADYAGLVAGALSDRVRQFMTMNEIRSFVELGYGNGMHAPGLQVGPRRLAQLNHYAVLGHGMAVQSIRALAKKGTEVGIADNVDAVCPVIADETNIAAARSAMREENASFLSVILDGRYSEHYLSRLGADAPHFTEQELKVIASPMDFVGLNIYQPRWVKAADTPTGYEKLKDPASYPHMLSPWLTFGPEALYWAPRLVHENWRVGKLFITENGASSADVVSEDGQVYDTDRTMYLRNYLHALQRTVAEGTPVRGYFVWSLLDNFEWADGYEKRFGITYVDFPTQKRIPKLSAKFFESVVKQNRVM